MALDPNQQQDPTFTQLPPGLDPTNLMASIQRANEEANRQRATQQQDIQGPQQDPQQPPDQQQADAGADQSTQVADAGATPQSTFNPLTGAEIVPHLQQQNEPYVPVGPRRQGEWGSEWWPINAFAFNPGMQNGQFMPSPMEAYGVIRGAGQQIAQWGAPSYGQSYGQASQLAMSMAPFLDSISGGRFSKNFNAARAGLLRSQRDEMLMHQEQALEQHRSFLLGANEIFGQYEFGGMTQQQAEQAMENYARSSGHENLINILHTKGLKGVEGFLQWEDQKYRDSLSGYTSLKKATGDDGAAADRAFEAGSGSATGADSDNVQRDLPAHFGPGHAPEAAPGAPQTPPLGESGDVDADMKKRLPGLTDREIEAARVMANGEQPIGFKNLTNHKQDNINAAANMMRDGIEKIARQPDAPISKKLEAIGNIEPSQRSNLEGILSYRNEAKDVGATPAERSRLERLAKQIDKNYDPGNYHNVHKFYDTNSVENKTITRGAGLSQAYVSLTHALKEIPENITVPSKVMQSWLAGVATGDAKWDRVYAALQQMAQETSAAATGGVPRVQLTKMLVQELGTGASPRQIRAAMATHVSNVWAFMDGYQRQWENITHRQDLVPGMDKDTWQNFSGILRSNPYTGEVPGDAPDVLKAGGKPYDAKSPRVKDDLENWRPLELKDVGTARSYIEANRSSADPKVQQNIRKLEAALGATVHPPGELPPDAR